MCKDTDFESDLGGNGQPVSGMKDMQHRSGYTVGFRGSCWESQHGARGSPPHELKTWTSFSASCWANVLDGI